MNPPTTDPKTDVVGVIGTGVMGSAFGRHAVAGGFEVHGFDTDADRLAAFAGEAAESAADVAERSDIVLVSLPKPEALQTFAAEIAADRKPLVARQWHRATGGGRNAHRLLQRPHRCLRASGADLRSALDEELRPRRVRKRLADEVPGHPSSRGPHAFCRRISCTRCGGRARP